MSTATLTAERPVATSWVRPWVLALGWDEAANALTHGLGLAVAVVASGPLVGRALAGDDAYQLLGTTVFAASLVAMYAASTIFHSVTEPRLRHLCRLADHTCIYLLIAGTYTPLLLTYLRTPWGWTLFGLVWSTALAGILLKMFCWERCQAISTALYVAMGWIAILGIDPILRAMPAELIAWIVAGGLSYTVGVYFFVRDDRSYYHAIWHLFVMGGSVCHFIAISRFCCP